MKRKTSTLVRESFLANPPKKKESTYDSSTGSFIITETLDNGEYRLKRYTEYMPLGGGEHKTRYSLTKREKVLSVFSRTVVLDVADKYLQPLFVDFYVRRK